VEQMLYNDDIVGLCDVVAVGDALEARKAFEAASEGFVAGLYV